MLRWFHALMPKEERFFDLFARHSDAVLAGAQALRAMLDGFRDEATRADRTQEFTQLDIEMAFMEPEELFELLERLFARAWRELLDVELELPFPRMTWDEATLAMAATSRTRASAPRSPT